MLSLQPNSSNRLFLPATVQQLDWVKLSDLQTSVAARFQSGGLRGASAVSLAASADPDQEKRHGIPAEEHQAQKDPRLDQEGQLAGRHRGDSPAHAEGTQITHALKVPELQDSKNSE